MTIFKNKKSENKINSLEKRNGQSFVEYLIVFGIIFGIPVALFFAAHIYPVQINAISPYTLALVSIILVFSVFYAGIHDFLLKLRKLNSKQNQIKYSAKKYLTVCKNLIVTIFIMASGIFLGMGYFLIVSFILHSNVVASIAFNENVWKSQPDKRYEMVKSLINEVGLKGRTRAEVKELLGQPLSQNPVEKVKCDECYSLGMVQIGLIPENAYLYIWYKDEKVERVSWSYD